MTDVEPLVTDFAASGRAGRRNALPDILGSPAGAGTSDLPHKLAELSVSEGSTYEGAEGGEVSSSKALLESQEAEGKSSNS
ncbi:cAMP-dependent protein kinase inhibitor beta isoform X1 [Coturnix japonica]|uniref:cAMP-dependent protein kinase inhibitor beta isoform X1 n=1 Tax=Coturnix japonica TaxID=93934 RepID=UPI00077812BF|nr:cAMP-dependent protein kinase inhibitor beta isoform X1 [Coturnix japonica]XP_015714277.1 cAMP-dependent protein kinase inhibitor beta isoform X1 [Coturnix japonica]XP_032299623.1 cAMP-dependent protein kinase inhibitor beta isoform X1 [Coturnix japonica]